CERELHLLAPRPYHQLPRARGRHNATGVANPRGVLLRVVPGGLVPAADLPVQPVLPLARLLRGERPARRAPPARRHALRAPRRGYLLLVGPGRLSPHRPPFRPLPARGAYNPLPLA